MNKIIPRVAEYFAMMIGGNKIREIIVLAIIWQTNIFTPIHIFNAFHIYSFRCVISCGAMNYGIMENLGSLNTTFSDLILATYAGRKKRLGLAHILKTQYFGLSKSFSFNWHYICKMLNLMAQFVKTLYRKFLTHRPGFVVGNR